MGVQCIGQKSDINRWGLSLTCRWSNCEFDYNCIHPKMIPATRSRTARLPRSHDVPTSSTLQRHAHFKRFLSDNRRARFYEKRGEHPWMLFCLTSCVSFMIKPNTKLNNGFCGPRIHLVKPFRSPLEHLWKLLACGLHAGNLETSGFKKFKLILKQK